jgi:peptidyl-prolyl cis-trans isomerase SurA
MQEMIARYRVWFLSVVVTLTFAAPTTSYAQVVVIANGSPITEYDIQQRMKLDAISQKSPNRQQAINDLIDDRLKIARAKVYGLEVRSRDHGAFENMAGRQHITVGNLRRLGAVASLRIP